MVNRKQINGYINVVNGKPKKRRRKFFKKIYLLVVKWVQNLLENNKFPIRLTTNIRNETVQKC